MSSQKENIIGMRKKIEAQAAHIRRLEARIHVLRTELAATAPNGQFEKPSTLKQTDVRYSANSSTVPVEADRRDAERQALGLALSDWLYQNDPNGLDWTDSRNVDELLDAVFNGLEGGAK